MIDTHAHIDFEIYNSDFDKVLENIHSNGTEKVVIPGVIPQGFERIKELIEVTSPNIEVTEKSLSLIGMSEIKITNL